MIKPTQSTRVRSSPYPKLNPILLSADRQSRKRKSLSWQPDEKIHKVHYFEYIADERVNVTRSLTSAEQQKDTNASANLASGSSLNDTNNKLPIAAGGKISNPSVDPLDRSNVKLDSEKEYLPWRPLILIDFTPELPSPGWNSVERSAQAERETYVLGAIDLPGQPSTLDEPENYNNQIKSGLHNGTNNAATSGESAIRDKNSDGSKIIPLDSTEGIQTSYKNDNMYNSEIVNGVRLPTDNPQPVVQNITPFCNQQSQLLSNQFQQQLVQATQNPFNFQDMGNQFQQAQLQVPFPFPQQQQQQQHQQQQQPQQNIQPFQQPIMPFSGQQPQIQAQLMPQQPGLTGPLTPWLSYPFNQVNENSHAHLFRRPAT